MPQSQKEHLYVYKLFNMVESKYYVSIISISNINANIPDKKIFVNNIPFLFVFL